MASELIKDLNKLLKETEALGYFRGYSDAMKDAQKIVKRGLAVRSKS